MDGGEMQDINIEAGNSGAEGLCRYHRKEYSKDSGVHTKSTKGRCGAKSINDGF